MEGIHKESFFVEQDKKSLSYEGALHRKESSQEWPPCLELQPTSQNL